MFKKMIYLFICLAFAGSGMASDSDNKGKIALVMKALSNPFFLKMKEGGEEYAKKNNIPLEVFGVDRETDIDRQISIIENLISGEFVAIVIAPADSKKLVPVCKKALDKGIIVVNIDNPFHKETLKEHKISIPFVGSDNRAGAAMVGNYIRKKLKDKGNAVIIEGIRGVENAELRKQGFTESLTTGTQIKILANETANWHKDEAFSVMTGLLQKHSNIDAVLCANDNMALGVVQAIDMLGLSGKIWVGAYDNIEEARQEMRNRRMHASVEQHPELMGEFGVDLAAHALAGEKIPDYTSTPMDLITYECFDKKIGLSISDLKNPFFASLKKGAEKAAELFGVQILTADAGNDDAKQMLDIQQFIRNKAEMIIINPANVESVTAAIEIADASGVKVITVDRKSLSDNLVISHIASDNVAGGMLAGEFIAKQLKENGNILEIVGIPGTSAAYDRGKGFNEAVAKYPGIKITAREVGYFDQEKAKNAVLQVLKKGGSFDAVFAHNDGMILGAIEAFELSKIQPLPLMVGFDAIPSALDAIKQKKLTATIAQMPEEMGKLAVQNAVRLFRGDDVQKETLVDLELISR